ncbi:hypothetical protein [Phocaeicola sp.]
MNKVLLLRDSLKDQGQVPSPGSVFDSPDLIVHEQVADPVTFFKSNYNECVCQPLNQKSTINLIYVRVKNLSSEPQMGYVHMYYSNASLFLNPADWVKNKLLTAEGKDYVETGIIQPGEVGVGVVPFVFNAKKGYYYCHVGYVSNQPGTPEIRTSFANWTEYVQWLHNNTHICMRNFSYQVGRLNYLESSCEFSNCFDVAKSGILEVQLIKDFPAGTKLHVVCKQLNKDEYIEVVAGVRNYPIAVVVAPHLRGVATAELTLPAGCPGVQGSGMKFIFYVTPDSDSLLNCPHYHAHQLNLPTTHEIFKGGPAYLIKVGECSVVFAQ